MIIIAAAIITIVLRGLPGLVPGDAAWYCTQWFDGIIISVWIYVTFRLIDVKDFDRKFLAAAVLAVSVIDNLLYPLWWMNYELGHVSYPLQLLAVLLVLRHVQNRNYEHESDKIDSDYVMLCFWRPTKNKSFFNSLLGAPFASVALYTGNTLWAYKWGESDFNGRYMSAGIVRRKFITINTGIPVDDWVLDQLEPLRGTPARRIKTLGMRSNCVSTIKPVLKAMGEPYRPRLLEFLPSLYAARILNGR